MDFKRKARRFQMVMMKKAAAVLLLSTALALTAVSAAPTPLQKGDILLNAGLGLGSFDLGSLRINGPGWWANYGSYFLFGGYVAVDYVLPIDFPLTIGLEVGYSYTSIDSPYTNVFSGSASAVPILIRAAWHPDFAIPNLDTYVLFKLGYAVGSFGGEIADKSTISTEPSGALIGFNIGGRYFFTENLGAFGELGYERVMGEYGVAYSSMSFSFVGTGSSPFQRFATIGVTYKL
jgi:hypothetical protein